MREISPHLQLSADQYYATLPGPARILVDDIRRLKISGARSQPSQTLVDRSALLTTSRRAALLDRVAALVDENLSGRSDMCEQFAVLVALALEHLDIMARPVCGEAIYFDPQGKEIWRWRHVWVRAGAEVIDGNVDCLAENPLVPANVTVVPYWGPIHATPRNRKLRDGNIAIGPDSDIVTVWWPNLKAWLDGPFAAL